MYSAYTNSDSDIETEPIKRFLYYSNLDFYEYNLLYKRNNNLICDEAYSIDADEQSEISSLHSYNNCLSEDENTHLKVLDMDRNNQKITISNIHLQSELSVSDEENNIIEVSGINEFSQTITENERALLNLHYRSNNLRIISQKAPKMQPEQLFKSNQISDQYETEKYLQMKNRKLKRNKNLCKNSKTSNLLEDKRPIDLLLKYINGEYHQFIDENAYENKKINICHRKKKKYKNYRQNKKNLSNYECDSNETTSSGMIEHDGSITGSSNDGTRFNNRIDENNNLSSKSDNYFNKDLITSNIILDPVLNYNFRNKNDLDTLEYILNNDNLIKDLELDVKYNSCETDNYDTLENLFYRNNQTKNTSNNNTLNNFSSSFNINPESCALTQNSFNLNQQISSKELSASELSKDNLINNNVDLKSSESKQIIKEMEKKYNALNINDSIEKKSLNLNQSNNHLNRNLYDKKHDFVIVQKKKKHKNCSNTIEKYIDYHSDSSIKKYESVKSISFAQRKITKSNNSSEDEQSLNIKAEINDCQYKINKSYNIKFDNESKINEANIEANNQNYLQDNIKAFSKCKLDQKVDRIDKITNCITNDLVINTSDSLKSIITNESTCRNTDCAINEHNNFFPNNYIKYINSEQDNLTFKNFANNNIIQNDIISSPEKNKPNHFTFLNARNSLSNNAVNISDISFGFDFNEYIENKNNILYKEYIKGPLYNIQFESTSIDSGINSPYNDNIDNIPNNLELNIEKNILNSENLEINVNDVNENLCNSTQIGNNSYMPCCAEWHNTFKDAFVCNYEFPQYSNYSQFQYYNSNLSQHQNCPQILQETNQRNMYFGIGNNQIVDCKFMPENCNGTNGYYHLNSEQNSLNYTEDGYKLGVLMNPNHFIDIHQNAKESNSEHPISYKSNDDNLKMKLKNEYFNIDLIQKFIFNSYQKIIQKESENIVFFSAS